MAGEEKRYNIIREKSGLSKKDFAESLGLSLSTSYQISSGRIKPPRELLERLSSKYNVNLHWFLTGNGFSGLDEDCAEIDLFEQEAAAGYGREVDYYQGKSPFRVPFSLIRPHRPENLKAVYVSGDSMINERINNGDIIFFNTKKIEGNGIFVISNGNTLLVKRVDRDLANGTITLISANNNYEPRKYSGNELNDIKIIGQVVACWHKI